MSSCTQPTVVLKDLCSIISDKDLQILLSQKDIAPSIAEDLLLQFTAELEGKADQKKKHITSERDSKVDIKSESIFDSIALSNSFAFQSTSTFSNDNKSTSKSESASKDILSKSKNDRFLCPPSLSINMSSSQLLTACRGLGRNGVSNTKIMSELCPPPSPPDPPYPPIPKDQLLPPTPSVFVSMLRNYLLLDSHFYC